VRCPVPAGLASRLARSLLSICGGAPALGSVALSFALGEIMSVVPLRAQPGCVWRWAHLKRPAVDALVERVVMLCRGAGQVLGSLIHKSAAASVVLPLSAALVREAWACQRPLQQVTSTAALFLVPQCEPAAASTAQAHEAGVHPKATVYAAVVGVAMDLTTSLGYQTNLMVSGPGGYRHRDYFAFGGPLQLLSGVLTIGLSYRLFA
jgi:hypothetical protein